MRDHIDRLTIEQRDKLEDLRAIVEAGELSVVNEFQPDGSLRSHSIGLTSYRLPEIILYGLPENEVPAFFDAFFMALHDPAALGGYRDMKVGSVLAYEAERLVPLLSCVFPDGFKLCQVILPKSRLAIPSPPQAYRQPKVYARKLRDSLLPLSVIEAEQRERGAHHSKRAR